jgi:hypothetical protein
MNDDDNEVWPGEAPDGMVHVYALASRISTGTGTYGEIRYVGRTHSMAARFEQHWNGRHKTASAVAKWLHSLESEPVMLWLGTVPVAQAAHVENYWISAMKMAGARLLNGDGGPGAWGAFKKGSRKQQQKPPFPPIAPKAGQVPAFISAMLESGRFIEDHTVSASHCAQVSHAYRIYRTWCAEQSQLPLRGLKSFSQEVSQTYPRMRSGGTRLTGLIIVMDER